jgi:hypothetical protein
VSVFVIQGYQYLTVVSSSILLESVESLMQKATAHQTTLRTLAGSQRDAFEEQTRNFHEIITLLAPVLDIQSNVTSMHAMVTALHRTHEGKFNFPDSPKYMLISLLTC